MWNWLGITNDPKKPTEDETSGDGSQTTEKNINDVSKENETMSTEKKVAEAASNLTSMYQRYLITNCFVFIFLLFTYSVFFVSFDFYVYFFKHFCLVILSFMSSCQIFICLLYRSYLKLKILIR